jgi:hypothetical protein
MRLNAFLSATGDDRLDGTFLGSSPFFVISDIKNFTSYFHVNGYLCVDLLKYIP